MTDYCVNLFAPLAAEERVLDTLLTIGEAGIFSSTAAHAHGFAHGKLSTREQVSGRSSAVLVQVLVAADGLTALIDQLQEELARSRVRYWVTPVIRQGEFR
ncbi:MULTISPECIES: DUF3240 family protein [unclassified Burkholderia]|uniref:DUF3240 family protein n=1 Tax=unclassified Burkholderia TaxID=2613784 RepID=UPI0010F73DA9|nr:MULTISPECIES: DUF3240 family protein [unclassified Burkholderia]